MPLRAEALAKGVFVLKDYKLTWSNEEADAEFQRWRIRRRRATRRSWSR